MTAKFSMGVGIMISLALNTVIAYLAGIITVYGVWGLHPSVGLLLGERSPDAVLQHHAGHRV
jgi:hypothetical protein